MNNKQFLRDQIAKMVAVVQKTDDEFVQKLQSARALYGILEGTEDLEKSLDTISHTIEHLTLKRRLAHTEMTAVLKQAIADFENLYGDAQSGATGAVDEEKGAKRP